MEKLVPNEYFIKNDMTRREEEEEKNKKKILIMCVMLYEYGML